MFSQQHDLQSSGRHGWRKLMPRPFHPKRDLAAQHAFKKVFCPRLPQHSLRFYAACLRLNPIAVGNQIVGGLLDLIRRQLRFASCGGHIVHRWKGVIGSTAG